MKNLINILSVILGVMAALASCHREDTPYDDIPQDAGRAIEFAGISASVDTKDAGDDELPIAGFKVWASRTVTIDGEQESAYDIFTEDGVAVTGSNSDGTIAWKYSPVRYWQPGDYDFIAVTPSAMNGTLSDEGLSLDFGDDGWNISEDQTDLLLAVSPGVSGEDHFNTGSAPDPVTLSFTHQLALVKFSARNIYVDKGVKITVTGIKIHGQKTVATEMTYDQTAAWTLSDGTGEQAQSSLESLVTNDTDAYSEISSGVLVFPQKCESVTVELTFSDEYDGVATTGNIKSATISAPEWKAGKKYEYNIHIGFDRISIGDITVTDWVDGSEIAPGLDEF